MKNLSNNTFALVNSIFQNLYGQSCWYHKFFKIKSHNLDRASDQNIIDRQGLPMQIHLLLVLIMFYLQVSTPYKYEEYSPAECLRKTVVHRHSSPESLVQIRVIVRYRYSCYCALSRPFTGNVAREFTTNDSENRARSNRRCMEIATKINMKQIYKKRFYTTT